MAVICKEHAESRCDCYPNHCYGCNAFANPTNFDRIKYNISKMDMEKLIDFCGESVICKEIPEKYAYCYSDKGLRCDECIREYLNRKPD